MRNLQRFGLAAICGLVTTLAVPLIPANASQPTVSFGNCTIDTGTEQETFDCFIKGGGGSGQYHMGIIRSVSGNYDTDPLIGTFSQFADRDGMRLSFTWSDGTEETVRGRHLDGEAWTIWIERGWAISFMPTSMEGY